MSGKIYGGTGTIGHLFVYNPATNKSTDLGQAVSGINNVSTLVAHNGVIYGGTAEYGYDAHLFKYDPASGFSDLGIPIPGNDYLYTLVVGADGLIYGGSGSGQIFSYNPATQVIAEKGVLSPAYGIRSLTRAANGMIYGGAQGGYLFSYNPSNNQITNFGNLVSPEYYVYSLVVGPDGKLYGGTGYSGGRLFIYDPQTGTYTDKGRAVWGGDDVYALIVGSNGLIYGGSSQLFAYNPANHPYYTSGTATSVDIMPSLNILGQWYGNVRTQARGLDGKIYFAGGTCLYVYNPADSLITSLGNPIASSYVYALTAGLDGKIYGGTYSYYGDAAHLFVYNPANGSMADLGTPAAGERGIYALVTGADGKIYGGTGYAEGRLFVYNPATSGLADLGRAVSGDSSIYALSLGLDGKIYGGTYGSGHFFIYNPADGTKVDKGTSAPGYSIYSLATAQDGRIYGGTNGGLFVYNPASAVLTSLGVPVSGATVTTLARAGEMIYGGCYVYQGSRYTSTLFTVDPLSGQQHFIGQPMLDNYNRIYSLMAGNNGKIYGGMGSTFFHYDPNYEFNWGSVSFSTNNPSGTIVNVDVYSSEGTLLVDNAASGMSLAAIDSATYPSLRLVAELWTGDANLSPHLLDWKVDWPSVSVDPPSLLVSFYVDPSAADLVSQPFEIHTSGDETVSWTASDDCPWMSVSPGSGTAPATVMIQVDKSGLAPYTSYSGTVTLNWSSPTASGTFDIAVLAYVGEHLDLFLPAIQMQR